MGFGTIGFSFENPRLLPASGLIQWGLRSTQEGGVRGPELRGLGCGPLALDSEVRIWELSCGVHEFALLLLSRHPK